jgi:RNase H-fold protein (predicted Holliday junction resolvase)
VFQPFVLWDERGSSVAARKHVKGDRLRTPEEFYGKVDGIAAEVILQGYIDWCRQAS